MEYYNMLQEEEGAGFAHQQDPNFNDRDEQTQNSEDLEEEERDMVDEDYLKRQQE